MRRYNFSLSPAYDVHGEADVSDRFVSSEAQVSAWTLLTAILLASIIFNLVWLG